MISALTAAQPLSSQIGCSSMSPNLHGAVHILPTCSSQPHSGLSRAHSEAFTTQVTSDWQVHHQAHGHKVSLPHFLPKGPGRLGRGRALPIIFVTVLSLKVPTPLKAT